MTYYAIIGWLATVGAIIGVLLNNCRLRTCFIVWFITNTISASLHVRGYLLGDSAMLSLAVRDTIFMLLTAHGWWAWGRNVGMGKEGELDG